MREHFIPVDPNLAQFHLSPRMRPTEAPIPPEAVVITAELASRTPHTSDPLVENLVLRQLIW